MVGAGYRVSSEAGDTATVVKLMRVAMLMPVIAVLVVLGSPGWVPAIVQSADKCASRWCLVTAISAIGIKTRVAEILTVGIRPIAIMVGETLFLAALVLVLLR